MKNSLIVLFLSLLFLQCKEEPQILFEMPYRVDFEITAGLNPFDAHYFNSPNINSKVDTLFSVHNVDQNEIISIQPHIGRLSTVFNDVDYDFVRDISVRIYNDDPDDFREIFYRDELPLNTKGDIDLLPTLTDIQDFVKNDQFNIIVRFEFRNAPPEFIQSRLDYSFEVK